MTPESLQTGQVVAEHRLTRKLGQGGSSVVWEGRDISRGVFRALKFFHPDVLTSDSGRNRVKRELETLSSLQHPHIISLVSTFSDGPLAGMVFERAQGTDLRTWLLEQSSPPALATVLDLMEPLCSALEHAHGLGIVHRDIKPGNVMVDFQVSPPGVRVLDFGIAKVLGDTSGLTTAGRRLGTYTYMSPEQIENLDVQPSSDLFSLATMLFELLTLRRPWLLGEDGEPGPIDTRLSGTSGLNSLTEMMRRVVGGPRPDVLRYRSELPVGIRGFFDKAWQVDPSLRFQGALELREALLRSVSPGAQLNISTAPDGRMRPIAPTEERPAPSWPSQDAPALKEGLSLAKFRLLRLITQNAQVQVWLAEAREGPGHVALKIAPWSPERHELFVDEARVIQDLAHPWLVVFDEVGVADGYVFASMPYVDGGSLYDLLKALIERGLRVDPDVVIYLGVRLSTVLHYIHSGGEVQAFPVFHRDVSPQNILVDRSGEIFLSDFGVAKSRYRLKRTAVGSMVGKPGYMSPEQARGEPVDARSDLFSLAIVLHECLAGRRLFHDPAGPLQTVERVLNQSIPSLTHAPALDAVLRTALQRQPSQRYPTALAFAEALTGARPEPSDSFSGAQRRLQALVHELMLSDGPDAADRAPTWILWPVLGRVRSASQPGNGDGRAGLEPDGPIHGPHPPGRAPSLTLPSAPTSPSGWQTWHVLTVGLGGLAVGLLLRGLPPAVPVSNPVGPGAAVPPTVTPQVAPMQPSAQPKAGPVRLSPPSLRGPSRGPPRRPTPPRAAPPPSDPPSSEVPAEPAGPLPSESRIPKKADLWNRLQRLREVDPDRAEVLQVKLVEVDPEDRFKMRELHEEIEAALRDTGS